MPKWIILQPLKNVYPTSESLLRIQIQCGRTPDFIAWSQASGFWMLPGHWVGPGNAIHITWSGSLAPNAWLCLQVPQNGSPVLLSSSDWEPVPLTWVPPELLTFCSLSGSPSHQIGFWGPAVNSDHLYPKKTFIMCPSWGIVPPRISLRGPKHALQSLSSCLF